MKIVFIITLTALLFTADASAQRSGQSMSVQTGAVITAQSVNSQYCDRRRVSFLCDDWRGGAEVKYRGPFLALTTNW